jgi:5-methylcytosine-specific restriction enzyme subunit McrC
VEVVRLTIKESKDEHLSLDKISEEQAFQLEKLGRQLATSGDQSASVISCKRTLSEWILLVRNHIGIIAVENLQIEVEPKIPLDHLIHLLKNSTTNKPKLLDEKVELKDVGDFLEVAAQWFLRSLEKEVLPRGLIKDYRENVEELGFAQGKINLLPTARLWERGIPQVSCTYDEYDEDNARNRVLSAACEKIWRNPKIFKEETRRNAQQKSRYFERINPLQESDLQIETDRRTIHYADALFMGKLLVKASGIQPEHGSNNSYGVLIRTPEFVEDGIRRILKENVNGHTIYKNSKQSRGGCQRSFDPDLVFDDGSFVGDVKYKLQDDRWNDVDLYQIVTFASAFNASKALIVGFREGGSLPWDWMQVGEEVQISRVCWDCTNEPKDAADQLSLEVKQWLEVTH